MVAANKEVTKISNKGALCFFIINDWNAVAVIGHFINILGSSINVMILSLFLIVSLKRTFEIIFL
jgi:hypothetical protein